MGDRQRRAGRAAERLLMHARTLTEPRWTPLPHQVPPPGNWYGWLLLAGRGAGKTDACARYVHDHIYGPPCLPGPVPHWVGIIAPTLGDAATSCVTGPSGLLVHSPEAKMVTVAGGTVVRWPNGSEAKLFGANTEPDTERLRSGGNRCAAEGTLVRTEHGERPIETIRPGDRVWTRSGLRKVTWSGLTRPNAETLVICTVDGHRLELTPDHRVWVVGSGWVDAQNVTPGSRMVAWKHLPQGLRHGTTGSRSGGAGTDTVTTRTTTATFSIVNFGRRTSVPWTKPRSFTTKITTKRTTTWATSSPSPEPNTATSTLRSKSIRTGPICRPAMEGESGPETSGTTGNPGTWSVTGVESPSSPPECVPSSAGAPVVRAVVVQSVEPNSTRVDTYDLTVEQDHEFFAGGLIVHNCLNWLEELAAWRYLDDAWAQMRFGLRTGPRPHWVASTTPKPRPLIKKLAAGGVANVVLARASMDDNPHLQEHVRQALLDEYEGTDLGRQELEGEILDQDSQALWTRASLEASRLVVPDTKLIRISIGVDPSGGAGEQGIVAVGKGMIEHTRFREVAGKQREIKTPLPHGYVLGDRTVHLKPEGWGKAAVDAAVEFEADDICVEVNFGGDMAVSTIRSAADMMGVNIPIKQVRATRGKQVRAQPVAALTAQKRWHMIGVHPELEDQYCTWYPELDWSPDRLDASVWPGHDLRIVKMTMTGNSGTGSGMAAMERQVG